MACQILLGIGYEPMGTGSRGGYAAPVIFMEPAATYKKANGNHQIPADKASRTPEI